MLNERIDPNSIVGSGRMTRYLFAALSTSFTFLPPVPADRKGVASGLIFVGLGLGIAATGTLVPFLLRFGLRATWIWLALFAASFFASPF
jgi:hypothetical protein